ncbi:hypothetical protein HPB50_000461 [Hyalomma asiaticum]|uniref:Uncharacterized protein n=1 Tax=Hyalomma asiaticum TaxID=266040 RepID=A0ACB7T4Z1_HYAAI|nr:hypothetical protein HPB50_000461 [Hyalomma asiaticum]
MIQRQESTIYEEDMPVVMRRRGVTMRVRIVSVDSPTNSAPSSPWTLDSSSTSPGGGLAGNTGPGAFLSRTPPNCSPRRLAATDETSSAGGCDLSPGWSPLGPRQHAAHRSRCTTERRRRESLACMPPSAALSAHHHYHHATSLLLHGVGIAGGGQLGQLLSSSCTASFCAGALATGEFRLGGETATQVLPSEGPSFFCAYRRNARCIRREACGAPGRRRRTEIAQEQGTDGAGEVLRPQRVSQAKSRAQGVGRRDVGAVEFGPYARLDHGTVGPKPFPLYNEVPEEPCLEGNSHVSFAFDDFGLPERS